MNLLKAGRAPKFLLILMVAPALAFSGGCGAPQAVSQPQFTTVPPRSPGEANYVTILGPVTGTGSKTFTIVARVGIAAWLGCIGKGVAWLRSPALTFAAACADGSAWAGGQTRYTHLRAGEKIAVRVVAGPTTRWEFRIDGTPRVANR